MPDEEECVTWGPPSGPVPEENQVQYEVRRDDLDQLEDEPLLTGEESGPPAGDRKTLIVSLCTLAISIPALIGAWCWPALVIGLISGTVSAAARTAGHAISLGITGGMMLGINIYQAYGIKRRAKWYKGKTCKIYGPTIMTCIAAPLILCDLLRHVTQDAGVWPECDRSALLKAKTIELSDLPWGSKVASQCMWYSGQFACEFPAQEYLNTTVGIATPFPHCASNVTSVVQRKANCGCVTTPDENMGHLSFIGVLFTIFLTYTGFTFLMIGTLWNANIMDKCKSIKKTWRDLRGGSNQNRNYAQIQESGPDYRSGV